MIKYKIKSTIHNGLAIESLTTIHTINIWIIDIY